MSDGISEKTLQKGRVRIFVVDDEIMVAEVVEAVPQHAALRGHTLR